MTSIEQIKNIIEKLRPFLQDDGGDVEFIKYENNIVYIKMHGACVGCELSDVTLKSGIEATIKAEIPEVIEVIDIR